MKTKMACPLGLLIVAVIHVGFPESVRGQDAVYAALQTSSQTNFSPPFYWIDSGHDSPWGKGIYKSEATSPISTPSRYGAWYHTVGQLAAGDGFGLVHTNGTQAGAVYEVLVTQSYYRLNTDLVMYVGCTNAEVGGVAGATAAGGWTNTTAFQSPYSRDQWAHVCYLTNRAGVKQPHIDFKYASGSNITGADRAFIDCFWFHLVVPGSDVLRITGIAGGTISFTGSTGSRCILLKSTTLRTALSNWERVDTNSASSGTFSIPAVGSEAPAFYTIRSE
jgi:hypothetical protein